MITVCGEAVADLVVQPDGDFRAYPGGSPANVAVALARLGEPVALLARLGHDVFGRRMRAHVEASGVAADYLVDAAGPSTLAVATVDEQARASYDFWTEGAADWQWSDADLAGHPTPETTAFHTGSLASWTPPGDAALLHLFARERAAGRVTLSYDPNARPGLVRDRDRFVAAVERFVALADVVKVSDEDLEFLRPGADPVDVARGWLRLGARLVVITRGPEGATAVRGDDVVHRPAPRVEVVDTVGAGDTFTAGLLHALAVQGRLGSDPQQRLAGADPDELGHCLTVAATAAALTCQRPGCDPPTADELARSLSG